MLRTTIRFVTPTMLALVFVVSCRHTTEASKDLADSGATTCMDQVRSNSCAYYGCLEREFKCGPTGYPLGYGKLYCERFQGLCQNTLASENAKKWITGTTKCLQVSLGVRERQLATCDDLATYAFNTHPECYTSGSVNNGGVSFCRLSYSEWSAVRNCINSGDSMSLIGLRQIASTASRCSAFFVSQLFLDESNPGEIPAGLDPDTKHWIDTLSPREKRERADALNAFVAEIRTQTTVP